MQPLTSIIVTSFHTGPSLFATIESVLQQNVPVELILIDNGNPDDVVQRLKKLATQDARISFLTGHGNIGFGRANNKGVALSRGEYILILNPDCKLEQDSILKLHQHAANLASPFMIGARILNEDGSDQRGSRRELLTPASSFIEAFHLGAFFPKHRLNRHQDHVPESLSPIPAISGACMFLPRADYNLIGGFDEGYFLHVEDLDLCFRFRKAGGEIYFAPDVAVTHIGGTSEASSHIIELHKTLGFIRYFHNNFRDKYPLIFLWILDIAIWVRYLLRRLCGPRIKHTYRDPAHND